MVPVIQKCVEKLDTNLQTFSASGETVDIKKYVILVDIVFCMIIQV